MSSVNFIRDATSLRVRAARHHTRALPSPVRPLFNAAIHPKEFLKELARIKSRLLVSVCEEAQMTTKKHFERVPLKSLKHIIPDTPASPAPPLKKSRSTKVRTTPSARYSAEAERRSFMLAKFDIFRMEQDGGVLWQQSAVSFDEAQSMAQQLASQSSESYFIFDHQTRNRTVVAPPAQIA
jgi:plasmid stability protein